jgi:hypothetical protein
LLVVQPPLLAIRTSRWKPRLDSFISYEVLVIRVSNVSNVSYRVSYVGLAPFVELAADRISVSFIYDADSTVKCGVHWPVIRESQRR